MKSFVFCNSSSFVLYLVLVLLSTTTFDSFVVATRRSSTTSSSSVVHNNNNSNNKNNSNQSPKKGMYVCMYVWCVRVFPLGERKVFFQSTRAQFFLMKWHGMISDDIQYQMTFFNISNIFWNLSPAFLTLSLLSSLSLFQK